MTQHFDPQARRVETTVVIHDELGLHARPAARLAQAAQAFRSEVRLLTEEGEADAKSILDILSLAAGYGTRLTLICTGEDAEPAVRSLQALFESPLARGES